MRAGVPGDMGAVRSTAGSLLSLRCDPGTTAYAARAGLSVKSSVKDKVEKVNNLSGSVNRQQQES